MLQILPTIYLIFNINPCFIIFNLQGQFIDDKKICHLWINLQSYVKMTNRKLMSLKEIELYFFVILCEPFLTKKNQSFKFVNEFFWISTRVKSMAQKVNWKSEKLSLKMNFVFVFFSKKQKLVLLVFDLLLLLLLSMN